MVMRVWIWVLGAVAIGRDVAGHGAIVSPRSRNSVDFMADPPVTSSDRTGQICQNITGGPCQNGQAAFWYSQGCFIGCPECDHVSGRRQTDLCGNGAKPTITNPLHRSINRAVDANSPLDIYRHNPWRWPGNAPVGDACGFAGGTPFPTPAPEEGRYFATKFAQHGMRGSQLPRLPTGVVWTRGGEAEVTWQVKFNHGGASEPLTEECFQQHPLDFVRTKQALVYENGTRHPINGTFVDQGTVPLNSTWAMIPLPPSGQGPRCICSPDINYKPANFDCGCKMGEQVDSCHTAGNCSSGECLPCPETPGSDCSRCDNRGAGYTFPPPCNAACMAQQPAILDVVEVPTDIPAGQYVLGFRYDCEATAQVWSNCADITVE